MLCIVEFTKYTGTEFKNFDAFKGLLKSSVFHYEDRRIKGNITLEEDIFKACPLSYPSTCSRLIHLHTCIWCRTNLIFYVYA